MFSHPSVPKVLFSFSIPPHLPTPSHKFPSPSFMLKPPTSTDLFVFQVDSIPKFSEGPIPGPKQHPIPLYKFKTE